MSRIPPVNPSHFNTNAQDPVLAALSKVSDDFWAEVKNTRDQKAQQNLKSDYANLVALSGSLSPSLQSFIKGLSSSVNTDPVETYWPSLGYAQVQVLTAVISKNPKMNLSSDDFETLSMFMEVNSFIKLYQQNNLPWGIASSAGELSDNQYPAMSPTAQQWYDKMTDNSLDANLNSWEYEYNDDPPPNLDSMSQWSMNGFNAQLNSLS